MDIHYTTTLLQRQNGRAPGKITATASNAVALKRSKRLNFEKCCKLLKTYAELKNSGKFTFKLILDTHNHSHSNWLFDFVDFFFFIKLKILQVPVELEWIWLKVSKHGLGVNFQWNFNSAYVSSNLQHFLNFDLFDLYDH